jgi:hypothetical protein
MNLAKRPEFPFPFDAGEALRSWHLFSDFGADGWLLPVALADGTLRQMSRKKLSLIVLAKD